MGGLNRKKREGGKLTIVSIESVWGETINAEETGKEEGFVHNKLTKKGVLVKCLIVQKKLERTRGNGGKFGGGRKSKFTSAKDGNGREGSSRSLKSKRNCCKR